MTHVDTSLPRDKDYTVHLQIGDPGEVRFLRGDITKCAADAVVNAANSELLAGGGVCGAIHRAAGPAVAEECRQIRAERGPLQTGQAIATSAGLLTARYVIHTVGPIWQDGNHNEEKLLASCYRESMRIADELKLHSIAFPSISTGIFGYPAEQAAWVAIPTVIECLRLSQHLVFVLIVLFDKASLDIFATTALAQRKPASGNRYEIRIGIFND